MQHVHESPQTFIAFTLSWTAMMSVMMAPTVAPWVLAYHRFAPYQQDRRQRAWSTAIFALGYFVAWILFGAAIGLVRAVTPAPAGYGGLVLLAAGLFQLSPLKQACLSHCRNPLGFLLARWRSEPVSALRLGLSHGGYCLGCCWALMLTMFAVGAVSLWWMAALTVVTFAEQVLPWGARLRVPIGLAISAA